MLLDDEVSLFASRWLSSACQAPLYSSCRWAHNWQTSVSDLLPSVGLLLLLRVPAWNGDLSLALLGCHSDFSTPTANCSKGSSARFAACEPKLVDPASQKSGVPNPLRKRSRTLGVTGCNNKRPVLKRSFQTPAQKPASCMHSTSLQCVKRLRSPATQDFALLTCPQPYQAHSSCT